MSDLADEIERLCGAAAGAETTARQDGLIAKLYVLIEANLPAITAALRASRPERAADAVEAMARAMFLIPTPNPGRGSILPFAEQPTVIRNVWLERARAALSALPRPEADEGAGGVRMTDTKEFMRQTAKALDRLINGDATGGDRANGFVLLVFPFGVEDGRRVNYVSNAARAEMLTALKEIVARFEGRVIETETRQ